MNAREPVRWLLAAAGPVLLEIASFMPLYGGAVKSSYRCRVDPDHCPIDYLPIMELVLPVFTIALLYPFARLSFSLFAPDPGAREMKWRLATDANKEDVFPILQIGAGLGFVWALWRATTYLGVPDSTPYLSFWFVFGAWFAAGLAIAWPRSSS